MSRALRKAQKQKLELSNEAQEISEDDRGEDERVAGVVNPFDLLNAGDVEDSDRGSESELHEDERQDIEDAIEASRTTIEKPSQSKKKSRPKKKKGKKAKVVKEESPEQSMDFDSVLEAHKEAVSNLQTEEAVAASFHLSQLTSIDLKMLDPNVEMRRLFGSKVVSSERAERMTANRRNMPRGVQQQALRGRKSVIVPLEDNYPVTIKGGLEMSMIEEDDGIRMFKFEHSRAYQEAQYMFIQGVQSGDPQTLMNLLTRAPFHVDTLLQVSEIMRHQGNNEQSEEMLTRALFAFDRAFHPLFNIASGMVRLPFEHPENRPFYLAIYRYIQSLGRRGCWGTAFEFNKLLYALSPEEDPYAALLSIDFYAIKARRWDYIQKLNECPWELVLDENYAKPNFEYAKALASYFSSSTDKGAETSEGELSSAIKQFPYFVGPLFNELKAVGPVQYDALEPGTEFARLVTDLYVFRSKDVYNTPELTKLLRNSALSIERFEPMEISGEIPMNVCRHILLLDERTLLHYLPKSVTNAPGHSFDPLPPANSDAAYYESYSDQPGGETAHSWPGRIPQAFQDLLTRLLRPGDTQNMEDADEIAGIMQQLEFEGVEEEAIMQMNDRFADPNGYGPNRGIDEPDNDGNAGRR